MRYLVRGTTIFFGYFQSATLSRNRRRSAPSPPAKSATCRAPRGANAAADDPNPLISVRLCNLIFALALAHLLRQQFIASAMRETTLARRRPTQRRTPLQASRPQIPQAITYIEKGKTLSVAACVRNICYCCCLNPLQKKHYDVPSDSFPTAKA